MLDEDVWLTYEPNQYATTSVNIVEVESHQKNRCLFFYSLKKEATMGLFENQTYVNGKEILKFLE